jgi:hypothetical protein
MEDDMKIYNNNCEDAYEDLKLRRRRMLKKDASNQTKPMNKTQNH